ncbi:MAG: hypothetical protein JKX87_05745 [Cycloclasticus sp.]|nr:hypothetical protein [Cycloclasticus sp.]
MHKYLEGLRQTGRTARMVSEAKSLAESGRAVYILFNERSQADNWRKLFGEALAETLGVKFETVGDVGIDWETMTVRGAYPNCIFLVDHHAIERRYEKQLEMMHKYDVGAHSV